MQAQTVQVIQQTCEPADIQEFIIVYCKRTTPESLAVCQKLKHQLGDKCILHQQKLPFIGGAMREASLHWRIATPSARER